MADSKLYIFLLLFSVFISAVSQLLLKKSALEKHRSFVFQYLNFKVISAYALFFAAVAIDLFALRYVPASYVPVIESSSYIFVMVLSLLVFKEKISLMQGMGMICILAGISIYVL